MKREITVKGKTKRAISPELIAETFGAEDTGLTIDVKDGPISLLAMRGFLSERLQSTGGRPKLVGTTKVRRKVSFLEEDWEKIAQLTKYWREKEGLNVTSSQVAAVLVHAGISSLDTKKIEK